MKRFTSLCTTGRRATVVALVGVGLFALPASAAPAKVSEDTSVPITVTLTPTITHCDNHSSQIDLTGSMGMAGLDAVTIFKNNVKGTKTTEVGRSSTPVIDAGVAPFPKQPVLDGVGGNPYISVGLATMVGGKLTLTGPTTLVGRCVQGQSLSDVTVSTTLPVSASAVAQAVECSSKGSRVTLDASGAAPAIYAVLVFDNNKNKVVHRRIEATDTVVEMTGGQTHKGWGQVDGAGGNPLVYLAFDDHNPGSKNVEFFLGRCKDLM
jgi:hypothetical protein